MELSDQVANLELSKQLHELGVRGVSYFAYFMHGHNKIEAELWPLDASECNSEIAHAVYNAYTVAELGMMLSKHKFEISFSLDSPRWVIRVSEQGGYPTNFPETFISKSEADCRAKALIYCIEQKLIKVEDINNEL